MEEKNRTRLLKRLKRILENENASQAKLLFKLSDKNRELEEELSLMQKALQSTQNKLEIEAKQFDQNVKEMKALEDVRVRK